MLDQIYYAHNKQVLLFDTQLNLAAKNTKCADIMGQLKL